MLILFCHLLIKYILNIEIEGVKQNDLEEINGKNELKYSLKKHGGNHR